MINNAVFITSLPRTGTTSISAMLEILGYRSYHSPLDKIYSLYGPGTAFSDTPTYAPSVIRTILKMPKSQNNFIYVDRDFTSWFDSMTKSTNLLRTHYRYCQKPIDQLTEDRIIDRTFYSEVLGSFDPDSKDFKSNIRKRFFAHREWASEYGIMYRFSQGWEPLCEYLELDIPKDRKIPHLHKNGVGIR